MKSVMITKTPYIFNLLNIIILLMFMLFSSCETVESTEEKPTSEKKSINYSFKIIHNNNTIAESKCITYIYDGSYIGENGRSVTLPAGSKTTVTINGTYNYFPSAGGNTLEICFDMYSIGNNGTYSINVDAQVGSKSYTSNISFTKLELKTLRYSF